MPDQSHLDLKYFVDSKSYNCPFCNRRHVSYGLEYQPYSFDWSESKVCHVYFVVCHSCGKSSMHLSFMDLHTREGALRFKDDLDLDAHIFYSVPTSFFVMDKRINKVIRELITEAEGCLKMNFLTGASACMRKAIYELLVIEKAVGQDYQARIKSLKQKHTHVDHELFDVLAHIQDMTSDKVHEQSWDKWDSANLRLLIDTLKAILQDIYVDPDEKAQRSKRIASMRETISQAKKPKTQRESS
jgi:hypothetical protein